MYKLGVVVVYFNILQVGYAECYQCRVDMCRGIMVEEAVDMEPSEKPFIWKIVAAEKDQPVDNLEILDSQIVSHSYINHGVEVCQCEVCSGIFFSHI